MVVAQLRATLFVYKKVHVFSPNIFSFFPQNVGQQAWENMQIIHKPDIADLKLSILLQSIKVNISEWWSWKKDILTVLTLPSY